MRRNENDGASFRNALAHIFRNGGEIRLNVNHLLHLLRTVVEPEELADSLNEIRDAAAG